VNDNPMPGLRDRIDSVDQKLLRLIGERLKLAEDVRDAKSTPTDGPKGLWRPSREESLVRDLVETGGVNAPLVSRIWAELVSASLAVQGPMQIHVGLEGDRMAALRLVRDRFGAALPTLTYPTSSAALAAAHADDEGVAVLPSPQDMVSWWAALCPGGAMEDMKIQTGLPRVRNQDWPRDDWPRAVAVASVEPKSSGADRWLVVSQSARSETLRAEAGPWKLYTTQTRTDDDHIIGILPDPLPPE